MRTILLAALLAVSTATAFVTPAKAYVCYSEAQYRAWGSACN